MSGDDTAQQPSSATLLWRRYREPIQTVLMLAALLAVMWFYSPRFFSAQNISNVMGQMVTMLIVAAGMTILMVSGELDISVGAMVGLAGSCAAWLMVTAPALWPDSVFNVPGIAIFAGVIAALLIGPVFAGLMGVIVTTARLPSFIVTLAGMMIARSLTLLVTQGQPIGGIPDSFKLIGQNRSVVLPVSEQGLAIPDIFLIALLIYATGWLLLQRTAFGRKIYAVGANPLVARLAGVRVERVKIICFMIIGFCVSIASLLNLARVGAVSPTTGTGLEFEVIAAVVIGGTSLSGGQGSILRTIAGVVTIALIRNFLNLARVDIFWQDFATGAIILGAVLIDAVRKRFAGQK
jgi:ribose transport system permease protein